MPEEMKILDRVNSPTDLRRLSRDELGCLSDEVRQQIINVVEEKGGHFSSPLGVVDLTVALHKVFDTPRDLLIWDVGHQCYAHKIVTGRRDNFDTLRQDSGVSGFCKRDESEYDVFGAGHASTSVSAAVGMARARDLKREKHKVVAIIGDGAMTGGLAYEGLNNAGVLPSQFLVVLNDNRMSISPTVGALSHYLTKIVTNPLYNRVRDKIWELTSVLPGVSKKVVRRMAHSIQEGLKHFLVPGMIFEELGIRYFGPIDGHNIDEMLATFENLKSANYPAVVHVLTRKGIGKGKAEADPLKYYSLSGNGNEQVVESPEPAPGYSKTFGSIACQLAEEDKDVVAVVAAMREGTGLVTFAEKFPDRFFDNGIAEGHAVTFSAGLSASGLKPIVAIYSTFLQRSYDMIIHDVALQELPVLFCIDRGGVVGPDGPTHHGVFDLSFLRSIPRMAIAAPKDGNELRDLMYTGLHAWKGPFAIRYPKTSSIAFDEEKAPRQLKVGSWEVLREGNDVAVLAVGSMVQETMEAIEKFDLNGLEPQLVNARFVKPLDEKMLDEISEQFSVVVTVEEGSLEGGFGSAVLTALSSRGFGGSVQSLGIPDRFVEHGDRTRLLRELGLTSDKISESLSHLALSGVGVH
ncbi:MAG: 1-deoxy-D-xylulose-5-phosphate synthase [Candidatus Neomarinimicrobiota bacterium]|nr:1-deoxy-D-xylulose-5-phosphate synthase [Candidatus Neomarinimicrobiota bacterium]